MVNIVNGKLYGIGIGPGDPELLTLKAISVIQRCGVIAIPEPQNGGKTAYRIVEKYLAGKEVIECPFAMENDLAKRKETRRHTADRIIQFLDNGRDVGFVTLGDPCTYSTYMYVHEIIAGRAFETEIIPGVTSYNAAAAALGVALCEGDEALTVIPAGNEKNLDELLDCPGNKVIMKPDVNLARLLEKLKGRGFGDRTGIACRVTMDGQRLYRGIEEYEKSRETGYLTVVIVSKQKDGTA